MNCPTCGSEEVASINESRTFPLAFGEKAEVPYVVNTCQRCQEQGDFDGVNDAIIEPIIRNAEAKLVARTIDELASHGLTMAYCERALGLAPRTMARWKNGNFSEAALVVLKMIKVCPALLEVARAHYEPLATARIFRAQIAPVQLAPSDSVVGSTGRFLGGGERVGRYATSSTNSSNGAAVITKYIGAAA